MPEIQTTPEIIALQAEWKKAKQVEKEWNEYRVKIETSIIEALQVQGFMLPETGTVTMEQLIMTFAKDRKWQQTTLGALLTLRPELLNTMFKWEYKPVNNREVTSVVELGQELGKALAACFTEKPKKTGFKAR